MDMTQRRNNLNISEKDLSSYLQIIKDSFYLEWLEKEGSHPIQILWKRVDELATNELYSLAHSIKSLKEIDEKWTIDQIKKAKSNNKNTYVGAIFELLALDILNSEEHPVKPTKINQAGYDGVVSNSKGIELRVSVKSYGISSFQLSFEKEARKVEGIIVNMLKKINYPPTQVLIDFPHRYPTKSDWDILYKNIEKIFKSKINSEDPFTAFVEIIDGQKDFTPENSRPILIIIISPIKNGIEKFHLDFKSYSVIISSQYHQNEKKNIFSKIEDACLNLNKHSNINNENTLNALFIRIPISISISHCIQWIKEYFECFPDKQISICFLYQPSVATDLENDTTFINNAINIFIKPNIIITDSYELTFPVGRISQESPILIAQFEDSNEKIEPFPLTDRYVYQHGEYFVKLLPETDGGYSGNIKKIGNGIYTSLVLQFPGQSESVIVKGRFPPFDEFLIM